MNGSTRHYLFGLIFLGLGVYHIWIHDYLEATLYCMAGLAFVLNTLISEARFAPYKKPLVIITWVLIIATIILFLYLLQEKYF